MAEMTLEGVDARPDSAFTLGRVHSIETIERSTDRHPFVVFVPGLLCVVRIATTPIPGRLTWRHHGDRRASDGRVQACEFYP